jgi:DNA-binding transcriptional MerR regulator
VKNSLKRKLYYSISEVAELTSMQPYTLRAWEREFSCLRPRRIHGKNRSYRERDIGIILLIKRLLYEERYTTQGANQKLKNEPELVCQAADDINITQLVDPKVELEAWEGDTLTAPVASSGEKDWDLLEREGESTQEYGGSANSQPELADKTPVEEPRSLKTFVENTRKELNEILQILG